MKNINLLGVIGISILSFSSLSLVSCDSDSDSDSSEAISAFVPDTLEQTSFRLVDGQDVSDVSIITFTRDFFTIPGSDLTAVAYEYIQLGGSVTEVRYTDPNTGENEVIRFVFGSADTGTFSEQLDDGSFSNDGSFEILDGIVR